MDEEFGSAKLCDFGLAQHSDNRNPFDLAGTRIYSAPEVLNSTAAQVVDAFLADSWSLGAVLFYMLCKQLPL